MFDKLLNDPSATIISLKLDNNLAQKLQQMVHAGYRFVEINTTEVTILQEILQAWPQLTIGASNVLNTQQLENCYHAGVHFASSPGFLADIAHTASIYSMHYLPGITTWSEAMQVFNSGYHYARPFPADLHFCTLLSQNMPQLHLIPGEVEQTQAKAFLALSSVVAVTTKWEVLQFAEASAINQACSLS